MRISDWSSDVCSSDLLEGGVVVDGHLLKAPKVIITTGARPAVPSIPGFETVDYLTSTSALNLEELPASLLVVGGGYVGAEIGQIFARAGVAVTIVCRSRLLPAAAPELGEALTRYLAADGSRVIGRPAGHTSELQPLMR